MQTILKSLAGHMESPSPRLVDPYFIKIEVFHFFDRSANRRWQCDTLRLFGSIVVRNLRNQWLASDDQLPDGAYTMRCPNSEIPNTRQGIWIARDFEFALRVCNIVAIFVLRLFGLQGDYFATDSYA